MSVYKKYPLVANFLSGALGRTETLVPPTTTPDQLETCELQLACIGCTTEMAQILGYAYQEEGVMLCWPETDKEAMVRLSIYRLLPEEL